MKFSSRFSAATLLSLILLPLGIAQSQVGAGRRFAARDPRACEIKVDTPTPAQLNQVFICEQEGLDGDKLYLASDVKLQIGQPRKYEDKDSRDRDVDTKQPIYDYKASLLAYTCMVPGQDASGPRPGHNCLKDRQSLDGYFYRTPAGQWLVYMEADSPPNDGKYYPPPK